MKKPENIFGYALTLNIVGAIISFCVGMLHEAGGGSLGYVIVGFAITGIVTFIIALIPSIIYFKRIFRYKSKNVLAVILLFICFWEVSFVRVLASPKTIINSAFKGAP